MVKRIMALVFGLDGIIFGLVGVGLQKNIETVAASPNSHGNVRILPPVFLAVGAVSILVSLICMILIRGAAKKREKLLEVGYFIVGRVTAVVESRSVQLGRKHPYVVKCEVYDPVKVGMRTLTSDYVMETPCLSVGDTVRVYVDPNNFNNYYVDVQ